MLDDAFLMEVNYLRLQSVKDIEHCEAVERLQRNGYITCTRLKVINQSSCSDLTITKLGVEWLQGMLKLPDLDDDGMFDELYGSLSEIRRGGALGVPQHHLYLMERKEVGWISINREGNVVSSVTIEPEGLRVLAVMS